MDNQGRPNTVSGANYGTGAGVAVTGKTNEGFGRLDPRVGAYVDDRTRTVFAKGLGWVNDRGDVYSGGKWFPTDQHHPEANKQAMAFAAKAKQAFAQAGQPPVPEQMRAVQARAAAPPMPVTPPTPPHPSHKLVADSFKHLANVLTKAQQNAQGGA